VRRALTLLPLLLLLGGCGDTWDKFMTPDFAWFGDRAVSADRVPAAAGAAPARPARTATRTAAAQSGCYRGRLTEEGNTCQAMRTEGGDLLTLAGPLRGFGSGDVVCVCGIPARQQFCKQGLTLLIREISSTCADIQ
jgi:hypothetical protein